MSWIFEPNFLLSFPTDPIHVMRFKDVNERMNMLYPYFLYNLFGKELDTFPVTDGEKFILVNTSDYRFLILIMCLGQ